MQSAVPVGTGTMMAVLGLDDAEVVRCCAAASNNEVVTAANLLRYFRSRPLAVSLLTVDSARESGSSQPTQACQFSYASATNTACQQEQHPM